MELDGIQADPREGLRGVGLGAGGGEGRVLVTLFQTPRRVIDQRLEGLDVDVHLGQRMLDTLEGADRLAELDALPGVADGELERRLGGADHLCRQRRGTEVLEAGDGGAGLAVAEHGVGGELNPIEANAPESLGEIDAGQVFAGESLGAALEDREAEVRRPVAGAQRHHEEVRDPGIADEELLAAQCAVGGAELDALGALDVVCLQKREGSDGRPVGDAREPTRLLLRAPALPDGGGRQRGRDQRRREQGAPGFLEDHHQIDPAELGPPVLLGDRETEPAELRDLIPQLPGEALGGLRDLPDFFQGIVLVEELPDLVAQQLLFFGEPKIHRASPWAIREPR